MMHKPKVTGNKFLLIIFSFIIVFAMILLILYFLPKSPFTLYSDNEIKELILVVLIIIISYILIILKCSKVYTHNVLKIILLALFLRHVVILIMSFTGIIPFWFDNNWHLDSVSIIGNDYFDLSRFISVPFYSQLTTVVYYIFGINPIFMQLINAYFGVLIILYVYNTARVLFDDAVALYSATIISFWPTHVLFTSMHMRESLGGYFLIGFLYYFLLWMRNLKFRYTILSVMFFIGSFLIRKQTAPLLLITVIPFIFNTIWEKGNKNSKITSFILGSLSIIITTLILQAKGYFSYVNIRYIVNEMEYRSSGGSAYLQGMTYNSYFDIIKYLPIRLLYFVFTPFIWQIFNVYQLFAFIEAFLLIIMTFLIIKNYKVIIKHASTKKELLFFVGFCLIGILANSMIDSNIGTAIRHKLQYIYMFFILYAVIRVHRKRNNKKNKSNQR